MAVSRSSDPAQMSQNGEAAFVFGNQDRFEATVAVARYLNPERAAISDDRLALAPLRSLAMPPGLD